MTKPKTTRSKGGRPSSYTKAKGEKLCKRIANGETLLTICKSADMPGADTVWDWQQAHPEFASLYARARIAQTRRWADEIVSIADDVQQDYLRDAKGNPVLNDKGQAVYIREMPQRTQQRIETRKWLIARINREEYGEKIEHQVNHSFDQREDDEIMAELQATLRETGLSIEDVTKMLAGPVQ